MGVKQRVNAGVRILDELVPNWRSRMPTELRAEVILPAAFGSHEDGLAILAHHLGNTMHPYRLGFSVSPHSRDTSAEASLLEEAWANAIAPA